MRIAVGFLTLFFLAIASAATAADEQPAGVTFDARPDQIDVAIGGRAVTSYLFRNDLPKPVLFPLQTPAGVDVTRGFPLAPREGESDDHPHHTGVFFAYDRVNGNNFWLNTSRSPHIRHVNVTAMEAGATGRLSTLLEWVATDESVLLEESRTMLFAGSQTETTIDFTFELKALDRPVTFGDTKEGLFGIRVADWMREDFKPQFGVITIEGTGDGRYLNSEGDSGEADVWGKRAAWMALQASRTEGRQVGVAIFNHPSSAQYPTYWHARSYGLFSANPLGRLPFEQARNPATAAPLNFTLEPGESATFRYRLLVYDGEKSREDLQRQFDEYAGAE